MKAAYAKTSQKAWLAIGLAAVGLAISAAIAANRQVSVLESNLLDIVYGLPEPVTELVYVVTQAGSVGAVLAVVVTAFALRRRKLAALLLANAVIAYLLTALLKQLIARPRPAEILPAIVVRLEHASGYGFPSGHTAIATVMALTLMPYTARKYQWLLWLWIAAVGFSRMYLGVHAPLDIIGGFCIGVIVANGMRLAITKSLKKKF
jgi:undecaprenyl-diphosphatase